MQYIADLHVHSPYSRATSKKSHLFGLASWAAVKGIQVIGTGDFTHPEWLNHLVTNLEEAEPGFHRLKKDRAGEYASGLPEGLQPPDIEDIRFVLTSEISSIYKRGGKVRKIHNIIFAPDFEAVKRMNATLAGIGNIESDGRPILGLDSRDLLEIVLEKIPDGFLVPAHIWTPWFSLFGSKSGFDVIEECFADLTDHIFALETGLSSDPAMNRHVSALDRFTLISNSDCHSPAKLGREANIFTTGFDYFSMRQAIRTPFDDTGRRLFEATIEFYPEEGKYHCDGHRKCKVCLEPAETDTVHGICPVCGRPVTVGVLHRVMELADRTSPVYPPGSPKVHSLVPLGEILSELLGAGPATKKVTEAYFRLIRQFGSEFAILLKTPEEDLGSMASPVLAEAIRRVRSGRVIRKPGFDGEFGVIKVFSEGERSSFAGQRQLFGNSLPRKNRRQPVLRPPAGKQSRPPSGREKIASAKTLNPEQQRAVESEARHIIVKAGPGTGKTHTLVQRVVRLVRQENTPCTVFTFTNKAADELQRRFHTALGEKIPVSVSTLHGYCLKWLRHENSELRVAGPDLRNRLLRILYGDAADSAKELDRQLTDYLQGAPDPDSPVPQQLASYFSALVRENLIDIDAVVPSAIAMLKAGTPDIDLMRQKTGHLFIDEFQDLNRSQYELVLLLAATSPVFAIGDPDQAIYGFRGSSPEWFGRFIEELQPEIYTLFRNYRSPAQIVESSFAVIRNNTQITPPVPPASAVNHPGSVFRCRSSSPRAEAEFVVAQIESLIGGTSHREVDRLQKTGNWQATLADIAVLYRTSRQAEILADAMARHGLPVQVVDIRPFYCSGPTRFLYLWILAAAGCADCDVIMALLKLEKHAVGRDINALDLALPLGRDNLLDSLPDLKMQLPEKQYALLQDIEDFVLLLRSVSKEGLVPVLNKIVIRDGVDAEDHDVARFFRLAENFGTSVGALADHLRRYNDSVVYDDRAEVITLMTIHAAKGLEFPVVFLAGLEEGLLPLSPRGELSPDDLVRHIEEERRLFYVGMTRAEKILYLSSSENRQVRGEMVKQEESRFIVEIPPGYFTSNSEMEYGRKKGKPKARQLSLF